MKKLYLTMALLLAYPLMMFAQDNTSDSQSSDNEDGQKNIPNNPSTRPKAPARKLVSFEVKDGFMTVKFRSPQGKAEMEVLNLDSGMTEHYEFDSDAPFTCFVGVSSLGYDITILTETGYTIKGTL